MALEIKPPNPFNAFTILKGLKPMNDICPSKFMSYIHLIMKD